MMKKVLLLLACLVSLMAGAQDLSFYAVNDLEDYQQVLSKAIENKQMIFVVLYEDNGDFQTMVQDGEWRDSTLYVAYDSLINMALKVESDMGSRFVELFGAADLPTFYYLTPQELLVNMLNGRQNTDQLKKGLKDARQAAKHWESLKVKYTNHKLSKEEFLEFLGIYELNFSMEEARSVVLPYLNGLSRQEKLSEPFRPVLLRYGTDLEGPYPEMIIANRQKFDSTAFANFVEAAYNYNFDRAVASKDSILLQKLVKVIVPVSGPDSAAAEMAYETRKLYSIETESFDSWVEGAMERAAKIENDSARADFLYSVAFSIADNFNTAQAQKAALKLAHTSNEAKKNYHALMLESYMLYLREIYDTALERVNEAQGLAEDRYQSSVRKLQKMIEKELPDSE